MAAITPPLAETLQTPRRRIPARRTLLRAGWLLVDLAATAAVAVYAVQALT